MTMSGWGMRRPPGSDDEIGRWRLDDAAQLRCLRAGLTEALTAPARRADPPDLTERLLIVATELAGNALRHSGPPVVVVLRTDGHVIVDVADDAGHRLPSVDRQRAPGAGGLGLRLAAEMAEEVGWYPDGTGKHVWASFTI
jgi:serine/threonine-protein kinase RsbW